jgi:Family of unknown function (DUF5372)
VDWVTVTHPHHPLCGQRVAVIRVRRGPDPDLIIRLPDGYHGAIAASWTDYLVSPDSLPQTGEVPLLDLAGLIRMAVFVAHWRDTQRDNPV